MSIRYFLRPNKLPTNPDAYVAHVKPWGTLMEEDIINRMQRQGSTITREDALAAVYLYQKTILDALGEGYNVVTDTVNYSASRPGTFPGAIANSGSSPKWTFGCSSHFASRGSSAATFDRPT